MTKLPNNTINNTKFSKVTTYKELPTVAGVYMFVDKNKKIIYVGKAINLKNRVGNYFVGKNSSHLGEQKIDTHQISRDTNIENSHLQQEELHFQKIISLDPKTRALVSKINEIYYIVVENEIEALLLEADLIKLYKPPYNINLKDDKFYKYIKIEKDRIITSRKITKEKDAEYFGPYPAGQNITTILKFLRKVFPYRNCSNSKFSRYKKLEKPCLYGHIGLCPAPCTDNTKGNQINRKNIKNIKEYLRGNRTKLFKELEKEMKILAKQEKFEEATILRDQIFSYEYLTQSTHNVETYLKDPTLLKNERINGILDLIKILNTETNDIYYANENLDSDRNQDLTTFLSNFRIETYDISNFQGNHAVGSIVVTIGGFPHKDEYRRFKIRTKDTPDDFAMMKEVLNRRFDKKNIEKWGLPNLIVIDGGKGQLSSAMKILKDKNLDIPIIGLAKKYEEIVIPNFASETAKGNFRTMKLDKNSASLKIVIIGRDEAHRFAISYYRKLHRKNMLK